MATILVRYKAENKFRFWNTAVDAWDSRRLTRDQAIKYACLNYNCTKEEAADWVDRKGYKKAHRAMLEKAFDSCTEELDRIHRRSRRD